MSKFDQNRIKHGWEKLCTNKQTNRHYENNGHLAVNQKGLMLQLYIVKMWHITHTHTQLFYDPFSGTTQVSQRKKKSSGLYGAMGDTRGRHTNNLTGLVYDVVEKIDSSLKSNRLRRRRKIRRRRHRRRKYKSRRNFNKNSCDLLTAIMHTKMLVAYFIISE